MLAFSVATTRACAAAAAASHHRSFTWKFLCSQMGWGFLVGPAEWSLHFASCRITLDFGGRMRRKEHKTFVGLVLWSTLVVVQADGPAAQQYTSPELFFLLNGPPTTRTDFFLRRTEVETAPRNKKLQCWWQTGNGKNINRARCNYRVHRLKGLLGRF